MMASPVNPSRRSFLRLVAVSSLGVGGSALLSACGASNGSTANATGSVTAAAPTTAAATTAATKAATTAAAATASASATAVPTAIPVKTGQTLIEFWSGFGEADTNQTGITAIKQMISDFQAQNTKVVVQNIKVDYNNQLSEKLLTGIAAGTPPNTYYADRFLTATWAHKGIFTDLTPLNSKAGITAKDYLDFAWAEASWNGKQWVLPLDTDVRMLYINVDAAQQAGVDPTKPPQNTSDLLDWTTKLTKADSSGNITQLGYWPTLGNCFHEIWMVNFGGKFFDSQANTCTANDPNDIDAFTYMQSYAKRWGQKNVDAFIAAQPKGTENTAFYTGKLVSWVNGDWDLATIKKYKPDLKFTVSPIPGKTGPGSSMAGGWSLSIPTGAKNSDLGYQWIQYATGKEGLLTFCLGTSHIPTLQSITNDPKLRADPNHNLFYDQLPKAWNRPVSIEAQTLWNDVGTAQKDVMSLKSDPKTALDFVVQDVNAQLQMDSSK
jgi:multiple sugar transport system substrate-binding protein